MNIEEIAKRFEGMKSRAEIAELESERLKQVAKDKQKRIRYWQKQAISTIHKFGDMERRALIAEDENGRLKEANDELLEEQSKCTKLIHAIQLYMGQDVWSEFCAQYATPEPTCKKCDGKGKLYGFLDESWDCPDCQGEAAP